MTQHRLNRCTLFLLQLQRLSDVLTGLCRPAQEVQHEGAVASISGFVWLCIHSRITTSQDSLKLIRCESLKTASNAGITLN